MWNPSHDSSIAKFLFVEMIGTAVLTLIVALSTYQSWRTTGVIAYGVVYYMLLRGMSMFHLRYTKSGEDNKDHDVSITPRFNPALTVAHFCISLSTYSGNLMKTIALILAGTASNVVGAMIGGTALMKVLQKPGGSAIDDVYRYSSSYRIHNFTDIIPDINVPTVSSSNTTSLAQHQLHTVLKHFSSVMRVATYESFDHYYTAGSFIEFVGLCILAYAFTVDDEYRTHRVNTDKYKSGAELGKPIAVGAAAMLVAYTFADYTTGICNPAISWGILMNHDMDSFYKHLTSSGAALLYLFVLCILCWVVENGMKRCTSNEGEGGTKAEKAHADWINWIYDNTFLQFGGLFFLTLLALHSVGDLGTPSTLRPERWSIFGPIFYGIAIAALVWTARHTDFNHDYFHPLANISVRFVALLGYAEGDHNESMKHGSIGRFVFVIIRDAVSVFLGVVYYYYVSPMRNMEPHTSHFVAAGFSTYNTEAFKSAVSKPGAKESEAFAASIDQGVSWPYLLAPEIIGSAMLVLVTMGAVLQDPNMRKRNGLVFGIVSALIVYLFGTVTTGTCNAWLSMFSLLIDGNWSEFWSLRVGVVHVAGVLTLVFIVAILLFDDMYNERGLDTFVRKAVGDTAILYTRVPKSAPVNTNEGTSSSAATTSVTMWDM